MMRSLVASLCRQVCGTSVQWRCDPRATTQRIYFSNHASHLDFLVIWSALPVHLRQWVRPVAAHDYWERTATRHLLATRVFNAVLVNRANGHSPCNRDVPQATTRQIVHAMGDSYSLILFPEGTRSPDGHVSTFKSGLYFLSCARPDVELIPVLLQNLDRMLPKGESLPVPVLSRVIFGPPLLRSCQEEKPQFLARAREAVLQLGVPS
jgi:1-acyl-sn-glycerol-3-phosphate acyltransferase